MRYRALGWLQITLLRIRRRVSRRETRRSVLTAVETGPRIDAMRLGDACHDYRRAEFRGVRYAFDERVDDALAQTAVPLAVRPGRFAPPEPVAAHAPVILAAKFRRGAALFNSRVARLATDLTPARIAAATPVEVQATDYFAGECTNEMAGFELHRRGALHFAGLSLLGAGETISDLADSQCANILGISTLAFTRDHRLVVVTQSSRSAQSANQLAPSGSGSAEPRDYASAATFQELVANAMTRELLEECGLAGARAPQVRTRVLGFIRILSRGGKPDFFGVSAVDADFETIAISRRERTYVSAIDPSRVQLRSADDLAAGIELYRQECGHRFSLALEVNLAVLQRYAQRHWAELEAFLSGEPRTRSG